MLLSSKSEQEKFQENDKTTFYLITNVYLNNYYFKNCFRKVLSKRITTSLIIIRKLLDILG